MSLKSKHIYLLLLFMGCISGKSWAQYSTSTLPNPKTQGQEHFVSDPDGILNPYTLGKLDAISQRIDSLTGAEFAIAVVNDYIGNNDFEFALELFNKWGIGKKEANNGLLLFIAKDRREYRFISGYGMERIFPDAYLKRTGEKYLVPYFREGDYDSGILEAAEFIEHILKSPDSVRELESMMPEAMPFWNLRNPILMNSLLILLFFAGLYLYVHFISYRLLKGTKHKLYPYAPIFWGLGCMLLLMFLSMFVFLFIFQNLENVYQVKNLPYFVFIFCALVLAMKITNGRSAIVETFKDEGDLQNKLKKFTLYLLIPMLLTPLAWFDLSKILTRFNRNKGRFTPPDESGNWERINRTEKKIKLRDYFDSGQIKEESIKSLRYEIWKNNKTGEIKLIAWEKKSDYGECPECHYYTVELNKTRTIRAATYSASGEGERYDSCEHCKYSISHGLFTIPRKVESSSSGSSRGGGSSGSRSSSRSSGSFGGGSSGGGGAGGRW